MYNKIMKKKVIENKIQKENRLLSAAFELLTENEILPAYLSPGLSCENNNFVSPNIEGLNTAL